jgi:hypothetical protein
LERRDYIHSFLSVKKVEFFKMAMGLKAAFASLYPNCPAERYLLLKQRNSAEKLNRRSEHFPATACVAPRGNW